MTGKRIIVLGLAALILIAGVIILSRGRESDEVFWKEKQQIEAWVIENDLNQYGDPKDRVYAGGTPLFDERTGETIDSYEYILRNHPDKPWKKVEQVIKK